MLDLRPGMQVQGNSSTSKIGRLWGRLGALFASDLEALRLLEEVFLLDQEVSPPDHKPGYAYWREGQNYMVRRIRRSVQEAQNPNIKKGEMNE